MRFARTKTQSNSTTKRAQPTFFASIFVRRIITWKRYLCALHYKIVCQMEDEKKHIMLQQLFDVFVAVY